VIVVGSKGQTPNALLLTLPIRRDQSSAQTRTDALSLDLITDMTGGLQTLDLSD